MRRRTNVWVPAVVVKPPRAAEPEEIPFEFQLSDDFEPDPVPPPVAVPSASWRSLGWLTWCTVAFYVSLAACLTLTAVGRWVPASWFFWPAMISLLTFLGTSLALAVAPICRWVVAILSPHDPHQPGPDSTQSTLNLRRQPMQVRSVTSVRTALILGLVLWGANSLHAATILFNQAPQYPGLYNAAVSQNQASGAQYQTYDDFSLAGGGTISQLTWQGFYWNRLNHNANPPAPNTTSFQVGFFQNNLGLPGTLVAGPILLTSVKSTIVGNSIFNGDPVQIRNYSANLQSSFSASPGTTYWLSIVSFASGAPPEWLWTSGQGGDNYSAQEQYGVSLTQIPRDRAFALYAANLGDPLPPLIPEPGTCVLAGLGLVTWLSAQALRRTR